jgi:D-arabinose 1-dehydrogenase-like Zn-dependent alcohol dehydrogenase
MAVRHAQGFSDTMKFTLAKGVRPLIEKFPLAKVNEAYERMVSVKAEFRVVLTIGS